MGDLSGPPRYLFAPRLRAGTDFAGEKLSYSRRLNNLGKAQEEHLGPARRGDPRRRAVAYQGSDEPETRLIQNRRIGGFGPTARLGTPDRISFRRWCDARVTSGGPVGQASPAVSGGLLSLDAARSRRLR